MDGSLKPCHRRAWTPLISWPLAGEGSMKRSQLAVKHPDQHLTEITTMLMQSGRVVTDRTHATDTDLRDRLIASAPFLRFGALAIACSL